MVMLLPACRADSPGNLNNSQQHTVSFYNSVIIWIFQECNCWLIDVQVLAEVREKRDEKKKVLEEQLQIIQGEKQKVDQDVQVINP